MRTNDCTLLMSPRRSAAARFSAGRRRSLRSASRCRRCALVQARQACANPSVVRPEALKAAADKLFRQRTQVFLSIMWNSLLGRLKSRAEQLAQHILPLGNWHNRQIAGRTIHGGVLLALVGSW